MLTSNMTQCEPVGENIMFRFIIFSDKCLILMLAVEKFFKKIVKEKAQSNYTNVIKRMGRGGAHLQDMFE